MGLFLSQVPNREGISVFANWALYFQTLSGALLLLPHEWHYSPAPGEVIFTDNILNPVIYLPA